MNTRDTITELLNSGHSDSEIARRLHVGRNTIAAHRKTLRLPPGRRGCKPAASPEELFRRHTRPTADGHLEWTGYTTADGVPELKHGGRGGRVHTAYRIAFGIAHDRPPVGQVRTGCDRQGCVEPEHVEDRTMREQYRAIFREAA